MDFWIDGGSACSVLDVWRLKTMLSEREEKGNPPKQEASAAATTPTAAGHSSSATAAVCLCLNSLGYRPGVECACGGGGAARHQEQWARNFLQAAAAHCYRGQ